MSSTPFAEWGATYDRGNVHTLRLRPRVFLAFEPKPSLVEVHKHAGHDEEACRHEEVESCHNRVYIARNYLVRVSHAGRPSQSVRSACRGVGVCHKVNPTRLYISSMMSAHQLETQSQMVELLSAGGNSGLAQLFIDAQSLAQCSLDERTRQVAELGHIITGSLGHAYFARVGCPSRFGLRAGGDATSLYSTPDASLEASNECSSMSSARRPSAFRTRRAKRDSRLRFFISHK